MPIKGNEQLSIGEVANRTGLAVSAIRFYESQGLVRASRNAGGQRRFARSAIRRLSFVLIAQQLGYQLEQIKAQLAELPQERTPTQKDWARLSRGFRSSIDQRIETLTRLREKLDGCIGCGCLSLKKCRLYNPDDKAFKRGPGPSYVIAPKTRTQGIKQRQPT